MTRGALKFVNKFTKINILNDFLFFFLSYLQSSEENCAPRIFVSLLMDLKAS